MQAKLEFLITRVKNLTRVEQIANLTLDAASNRE